MNPANFCLAGLVIIISVTPIAATVLEEMRGRTIRENKKDK